jgi:hypothetical protein
MNLHAVVQAYYTCHGFEMLDTGSNLTCLTVNNDVLLAG